MNPAEYAASLAPSLHEARARAFVRDALLFVGLATAVALGVAAVLSAFVLLLADPADATTAVDSAPASRPQPQSSAPDSAQCTRRSHVTVSLEAAESPERCGYLMRIPNAPDATPAPALLRVRGPAAALRRIA